MKVIVGGIIEKNGKYLLVQEAKKKCYKKWNFPAGHLDFNASLEQGAIREIKEETNLDVKEVTSYVNSFDYISGSGKKARQYNFVVKVESTDEVLLTEHDSYKWQSIDEARNNPKITDEVKFALEIYYFNSIKEGK